MSSTTVNAFSVLAKIVPTGASAASVNTVQTNGVIDAIGAERIYLREAAGNISGLVRKGADLIVYGPNGEVLTVQNFYAGVDAKQLLLMDNQGGLVAMETAAASDGPMALYSSQYPEPAPFESLTTNSGEGSSTVGAVAGAAMAVVAGLGVIGTVVMIGNDKDDPDAPPELTPPADTTPPSAPSGLFFAANGSSLSGTAEAGSTVTVRNAAGQVIGTTTAGSDGSFTINFSPALINSEPVSVTATDAAGNVSQPANATAPDLTPPAAADELAFNDDGTVLTGEGEAGASVEVYDSNNNLIGTGTVASDGTFSITLSAPQQDGQTVSVILKDTAGNASQPATIEAPVIGSLEPLGQPTLDFPQGEIDTMELEDGIEARVSIPQNAGVGDTVHVSVWYQGTFYDFQQEIVPEDIGLGYVTINLGSAWADNTYTALAYVRSADGRVSPYSESVSLVVAAEEDTTGNTPISQPSLVIADAADGLVDEAELADGIEARVTFGAGGGVEGQTVTVAITVGGVTTNVTHTVTAADVAAGYADINLGSNFAAGSYSVVATITNNTGGASPASSPVTYDVVIAPASPTTATLSEATPAVPATGSLDPDGENSGYSAGTPTGALTSRGEPIVWSVQPDGTLSGMAGSRLVITFRMEPDGSYTSTLHDGVDHIGTDQVTITIPYSYLGASGTQTGTISLDIDDAGPATHPALELDPTAPSTLTGSLMVDVGMDGAELTSVSIDGQVFDIGTLSWTGNAASITGWALEGRTLIVSTARGETATINLDSGDYNVVLTGEGARDDSVNSDPLVDIGGSKGLGNLLKLNVLDTINLAKDQALIVSDLDNDLAKVELRFTGVTLSGNPFRWNTALAAEFGLSVTSAPGLGTSSMVVTAINGQAIDSFKLNEFLATISLDTSLLGVLPINLGLFNYLRATVTDMAGNTDTAADFTLIDAGVGNGILDGTILDDYQNGSAGADTLNAIDRNLGRGFDNRLYGFGGDDILNGGSGSDLLRGGSGNDILNGGAGSDVLIGGSGNDTLTGGAGLDVFRFERSDVNTMGVDTDIITDFDTAALNAGGDVLDLSDMLFGEGRIGNSAGNLVNFLHFVQVGANTEIHISSRGGFVGGYNAALVDHKIVLQNVLLEGSDLGIISRLLQDGKLVVDSLKASQLEAGSTDGDLTIGGVVVDYEGDTGGSTVVISDDLIGDESANTAPVVGADAAAIQLLISGNFANYDLSAQDLAVADEQNNLAKVSLQFISLINVGLSDVAFGYDATLAHALGLSVRMVTLEGIAGIVMPGIRMEITQVNGLNLDNEQINLFLKTVHLTSGDGGIFNESLLNLSLLNAMTLTATDVWGASDSDTLGSFLNVNALTTLLGNTGADTGGHSFSSFMLGISDTIDVPDEAMDGTDPVYEFSLKDAILIDDPGLADWSDGSESGQAFEEAVRIYLDDDDAVVGSGDDALASGHTAFDPGFTQDLISPVHFEGFKLELEDPQPMM